MNRTPRASTPGSRSDRQHQLFWAGRGRAGVYRLLLAATDSGPFDGGCVLLAQAMSLRYGGEVCVLCRAGGKADHAVLRLGRTYLDGDGRCTSRRAILDRFSRMERTACVAIRVIRDSDLLGAPRHPEAARAIAALLPSVPPRPLPLARWLQEIARGNPSVRSIWASDHARSN